MAKTVSYSYSGGRYPGYRGPVMDRINLIALLRRSLRMFRSRWWIVLLTLSASTGIAIYKSMTTPDTFRATSRLSIAPRVSFSQRSPDRAVVLEEKSNYNADQLEYMRGSQVLGRVEEKMQDFRLPDGGVPTKRLTVSQGQGSTFIMTVDSSNLEYARQYARTWAQEFLSFKEQIRMGVARKQIDRTRVDLSLAEESVAEAQTQLDDFIRQHRINTSQDTVTAAYDLLSTLQKRQQQVRLNWQNLELKSAEVLAEEGAAAAAALSAAQAAALASGTPAPNASVAPTAGVVDDAGQPMDSADPLDKFTGKSSYRELKLSLRAVESEMARQAEFLKPAHPYMVRLAESQEEHKRQIKEQLAIIEELRQAQIASMKKEEEVLDKQIYEKRIDVDRLGAVHRQYLALREDLDAKKQHTARLTSDLAALAQIPVSEEQLTILEEGQGSDKPVGPARSRIIITGIAIGLVAGMGLIFLLHRLDDRVESAEELEKALEEPILGQIPLVSRRDLRGAPFVLVDGLDSNNIFVEAFRGVRSSVMFGDLGGAKQVLMATSSVPGDGKSTFTVNFAITLANAGNRVLLIDADLRRGSVAEIFGVPEEPGLSEVLGGLEKWTDVLNATKHRTLLIITAGKSVSNPGEMLLSKVMKRFLEQARREFDYIIFDSPPIIGMDDAPTLATHCDGLIFVYRVGVTSLKLAKLAVNTARQRGGKLLGLILNGVSLKNPDYYYTAYYYSHYTYGSRPGKRALPEGEAEPVHRPEGARLLAALKDAEGKPGNGAPHAGLLEDETGSVDVQARPSGKDDSSGTKA